MDACPLLRAERVALARVALAHGARLREVRQDLEEATSSQDKFKRKCPAKTALEEVCADLCEEEQRLLQAWREEAKAVARAQDGSSQPVAIAFPTGVRPAVVRGRRWFFAELRGQRPRRFLGPLRPTVNGAAEDYMALCAAAGGQARAGDA